MFFIERMPLSVISYTRTITKEKSIAGFECKHDFEFPSGLYVSCFTWGFQATVNDLDWRLEQKALSTQI